MKVPAPIYRTVASVVSALDAPARFEDILAAVERVAGDRVAPYCVRVPLRFWAATGLITHAQARFAPALAASRFETESRRAWRRIAGEPLSLDENSPQ